MNSTILVSVIVPIYKVEDYLSKCIDSILNQTYKNLEIILVDDGSPDNCGKICDDYALKDPRIKVIHKTNGGLSDARNVAIDIMNGDYVTFIDSDDFVKPNYIETLYNLITEFNVPLAVSGFIHFHEIKGEKINSNVKSYKEFFTATEAVETMFYQRKIETSAWGKLYKKDLFGSDIRYPKGMLYEDLPTTYKLMLRASVIAITTQQTYFYLLRENSIQYSAFNPRKLDVLKAADLMIPDICSNYPELTDSLKCRLFSAYLNIFLQTDKGNEYEQLILNRIIAYRWDILKNIHSRKKAYLAALISLFGSSVLRFCFSFVNIRS